jgi:type IV secretory pathway VirD2 relaxase
MSTEPPDESTFRPRIRFSRSAQKGAHTPGQRLLGPGLRTLGGKSGGDLGKIAKIAQGRLAPPPQASLKKVIRNAANGSRRGSTKRANNGRGAGVRAAGRHAQRVIVKARIVPLRGKSPADVMRNHLAYLARDGADRDGERGKLFNGTGELDREAVDAFTERGVTCRHQFRFIVSAERGADVDLPRFTRDLMRQMERDVGSRLDYVACVHHDTDQPHVHIVLNGRDDRGGDLVIGRDYIGNGLRQRAMDRVTDELGYRSELDVFRSLTRDIHADRFTALDRRLQSLQERDPKGCIDLHVAPADARASLQRRLYLGRLAHLRSMDLAEESVRGIWHLKPDAVERLRGHTQHRTIQQYVNRHVTAQDRVAVVDVVDKANLAVPITGRVLGRGLANELSGTQYLVVAGMDGKTYYAALSAHSERYLDDAVRRGDIVSLRREIPQATGQADRTITALAAGNGGLYDPRLHAASLDGKRLPFDATPERFVEAHVRRLEALASRGFVTREPDGRYRIPSDLLARLDVEPGVARDDAFVRVDVHARVPLRNQVALRTYTWLDEQLVAGNLPQLRQVAVRTQFQDELIEAADQRVRRLVQLGLALIEVDGVTLDAKLRDKLDRIEHGDAVARLSRQYGRFVDCNEVRQFDGRVAAIESLTSGPHAVVVSGERFALVPADRGLARQVGKDVSLSVSGELEQARVRYRVLDAMNLSPSLGR